LIRRSFVPRVVCVGQFMKMNGFGKDISLHNMPPVKDWRYPTDGPLHSCLFALPSSSSFLLISDIWNQFRKNFH